MVSTEEGVTLTIKDSCFLFKTLSSFLIAMDVMKCPNAEALMSVRMDLMETSDFRHCKSDATNQSL